MGQLFLAYTRLFRLSGLVGLSLAPVFGDLSLINIGVKIDFLSIFLVSLNCLKILARDR